MHVATIGANPVVKVPSLVRCRLERAFSQRELGERAGVSHVTIARLERGSDAHPRTIRKLAAALGMTPSQLMAQPPES